MNPLTYHRIERLMLEIRQRQDEILRLAAKERSEQVAASVNDVVEATAAMLNVNPVDIYSDSHIPGNSNARHVAMWVCVKLWYENGIHRMTKSEIARQFNKTHGAVINAVKNVNGWRDTEPGFRQQTDELLESCSSIKNPKQLTLFKAA